MREKTIRQLWGRDFEIVREGLAESEIVAFITELIDEREVLMQRQGHLSSLTKLAERTVAEADKVAEDLKREAGEEAKAKATKILAEAEQEAQKIMEQKRSEILAVANKEAQVIKDGARQEVDVLMAQHRQRVQVEIKETVGKLHNQLVSQLEGLRQQAIALQGEWESKLSSTSGSDNELPPAPAPVTPEQKEEIAPATTSEAESEYRYDILEQLEQAWLDTEAETHPREQPLTATPQSETAAGQPSQIADQPEISTTKQTSIIHEGEVELDIRPPLTPSQLVEIQRYLQDWPGVGITELRPNDGGYSIILMLSKPMQLIDILRELPEVEDAWESKAGDAKMLPGVAHDEHRIRKITITLSGSSHT